MENLTLVKLEDEDSDDPERAAKRHRFDEVRPTMNFSLHFLQEGLNLTVLIGVMEFEIVNGHVLSSLPFLN